ncbi:hypothetical protein AB0D11_39020 [Streptomyces monashensis]
MRLGAYRSTSEGGPPWFTATTPYTYDDLVAAAGLFDGRRAATHWVHAATLAERHPEIVVDPAPLYIGPVSGTAGQR